MLAETTARITIAIASHLDNPLALPDPCSLITQAEAEAASGFPTRPGEVLSTEMAPLGTAQFCNFLAADTLRRGSNGGGLPGTFVPTVPSTTSRVS
jgi:hypothetical protein